MKTILSTLAVATGLATAPSPAAEPATWDAEVFHPNAARLGVSPANPYFGVYSNSVVSLAAGAKALPKGVQDGLTSAHTIAQGIGLGEQLIAASGTNRELQNFALSASSARLEGISKHVDRARHDADNLRAEIDNAYFPLSVLRPAVVREVVQKASTALEQGPRGQVEASLREVSQLQAQNSKAWSSMFFMGMGVCFSALGLIGCGYKKALNIVEGTADILERSTLKPDLRAALEAELDVAAQKGFFGRCISCLKILEAISGGADIRNQPSSLEASHYRSAIRSALSPGTLGASVVLAGLGTATLPTQVSWVPLVLMVAGNLALTFKLAQNTPEGACQQLLSKHAVKAVAPAGSDSAV